MTLADEDTNPILTDDAKRTGGEGSQRLFVKTKTVLLVDDGFPERQKRKLYKSQNDPGSYWQIIYKVIQS